MAAFRLAKLVDKKLLKITGPDCYPYLQSLFCNDLRLLYEPDRLVARTHASVSPSVQSSFMLNAQGRIICDVILYRTPNTQYRCNFTPPGEATDQDELLIECDSTLASGLANTLYGYRVRRKVSIEVVDTKSVWCLFPETKQEPGGTSLRGRSESTLVETSKALAKTREVIDDDLVVVADPRLYMLGLRILNRSEANGHPEMEFDELKSKLTSMVGVEIKKGTSNDYLIHRLSLGVGEGPGDHPEGNCLPLESNADYLGSVSFEKGCYLGQELTARIHFTGVVRKRLMPVYIHKETKKTDVTPYHPGTDILDAESGKKLGILRQVFKSHTLALLRHDLINETTELIHQGTETKISTWKPYWWENVYPPVE